MKIAIIIATYRKLDGSTYAQLLKTLLSVKDQTHEEWKIFLIGDDYDDNEELLQLSKIIPPDKIYVENLPIAVERTKYEGHDLWVCAGLNAVNVGIKKAMKEGYSYISLLGHDDYYYPNHLHVLSEGIEKTGVHFLSTKCANFPDIVTNTLYTNYRPIAEHLYILSACIDFSHYPLRYVNTHDAYGYAYPSDADLWKRLNTYMTEREEWGIFINIVTCAHPQEGHTMNSPNAVKK